jgi:hypothetical protein
VKKIPKERRRFILKRLHIYFWVLALFLLCGCTVNAEAAPAPSEVNGDLFPDIQTAQKKPAAKLVATNSEPLTNYCLECHSDKQSLIDNAKPEEVVEKESKGVG